ncbi:hypothetical protein FQA39_LY17264 [Lamprigera yunnana]|nr:hypothetical protein FQA39_LY17264 [Lamprigera yunnana]
MGLESYLENQFFHDSIEIQDVLEQSFKDDRSVRNISRTGDINTYVKIYYNWKHTEGLSSSMTRSMSAAARNGEDFLKTITLYRDYQTCTFNRYEMENIFCLKPIIEYRLEKSKRGEILRMAAAAVGDVDVVLDENVCESMDVYAIFEQTLNNRCNINSHNVLCIIEAYPYRPGYIMNSIMSHR